MSESFNHFGAIAAKLQPALADIVDETADVLIWAMQEFIHINGQISDITTAGHLHMVDAFAKESGGDDLSKNITNAKEYWKYQNYGTRFIAGRPFVEPGVAQARPEFEARLGTLESRLRA